MEKLNGIQNQMNGSILNDNQEVLVSWIHEFAYCPRRFYLRVCEGHSTVNEYMVEGTNSHNKVDKPKIEKHGKEIQVFRLPIYSKTLNLYGICDRVNFEIDKDGTYIDFLNEKCVIKPIEYKHGRKRNADDYAQQLCAQAMCLEEMYNTNIDIGTIWYTSSKQTAEVDFSKELRTRTLKAIKDIETQLKNQNVLHTEYRKTCNKCSVYDVCNPKDDMSKRYVKNLKKRLLKE